MYKEIMPRISELQLAKESPSFQHRKAQRDVSRVEVAFEKSQKVKTKQKGSSWIVCGTTWIRRPALATRIASWKMSLSSTSYHRLPQERNRLTG
jgi:hypothetical protein